jgi:ParB family chromosome partitioning protein
MPLHLSGASPSDEVTGSAKPAMSQRLIDELATMKTELLAVHVANDPRFALDLGTFIMADTATRLYGREDVASELRANAPTRRVADFDSGTPAAEEWAKFDLNLDRSWTEHDDVRDRFDAFCTLPDEARGSWLGWAVARTLNAVPAGQSGSAFLDHIGCKLGIDVAAWWRPTARTYFNRITKPAILDLLESVGDSDLRRRYATSRKLDLATSAEKLFAGAMSTVDQATRDEALAWVPDAMRFQPHEPAGANDDEPSLNPDDDGGPGVDVVTGTDDEMSAPIADAA